MAITDLDLGPCQVLFGVHAGDAEVDLGRTEGGVRVAFSTDVADLATDQRGTTPEDQVVTGQGALITVPLAEYNLTNLGLALNQDVIGDALIEGENIVGTKLSSKANSLLLKKYVNGAPSIDEEDWIRFPEAAPQGNFEISFSKDGQRIIEIVFTAFPDDSEILYYIGDEAAS